MSEQRTNDQLGDLQAQRAALSQKIWAAEAKARREQNAGLIGKCFRYRNCYSCPRGDKDYWWLYQRVTDVDASGNLTVFSFQRDKYGHIDIKPKDSRISTSTLGDQITLRQFRHAWKVTCRIINDAARAAGAPK